MILGEIKTDEGERLLNVGRDKIRLTVGNSGDRPIQVDFLYMQAYSPMHTSLKN